MNGPGSTSPTVDILINNFNYARYLPEAIESARTQTHERVRVIVVDDGSTDGSRELLEASGDDVTVVLKENGGQASALNVGMQSSEGDVVFFLDADDTLRPDAAALAAAAFEANPALAKVQFRMEVVDGAGHPTGAIKPAPHLPMPNGDMRQAELDSPFDLAWRATSGNAFSAAALRRIFPMPENPFRLCADWYLVHLTALLGPVLSLEEIGAAYRVHGGNSYEPENPGFDLEHIRKTTEFARATREELERLADELGLTRPAKILSVWDLANRLISLRCDPVRHPIHDDTRLNLLRSAASAIGRRRDVGAVVKLMFVGWFVVTALAPRRLVPRLGELFLYSERRPSLNRLLGRLHQR